MRKKVTVETKTFPSLRSAAAFYKLNYGNVARRYSSGWSLEQALEVEKPPKRKGHNAVRMQTEMGVFHSIRETAKAYDIKEATLAKRLRDGWSIAEAVGDMARPIKHPKKGTTVYCNGIKYESIFDFADAFSCNRIKIRQRLNRGWTPEEAVELHPPPPRFRNQNGSERDHSWTGRVQSSRGETVPVSQIGKYTLYLISNENSSKEYVGITTGDIKARFRGHWHSARSNRQSKLYNAMRKAEKEGRSNDFRIQKIRDDAKNFDELQMQEYHEIKLRNSIEDGYNTAEGGSLGTPTPIEVAGQEFISQLAAAQHFGVEPYNFNQRISKLGWTPEQAAGLDDDKNYATQIKVNGIKYSSISSACNALGKSYKNVFARLHNYGWTIEQAFDLIAPPELKKSPNSIKLSTSIGSFESLGEAAKATGIKMGTIAHRLKNGWSPDQAVGAAKKPSRKKNESG